MSTCFLYSQRISNLNNNQLDHIDAVCFVRVVLEQCGKISPIIMVYLINN